MCIIAVSPAGKAMFDDSTISRMFNKNHDGAGIMWTENNKVHIHKGMMTEKEVLKFVHSRDWTKFPLIMHFRIGTSGGNTKLNCHPYPIYQKNAVNSVCDIAFAHNGVLHKYNPPIGAKVNDTQMFARTILDKLPRSFMRNQAICTLLESETKGNRLAFLDKTGKIKLLGDWIHDGDYYFSNHSYEAPKPIYTAPMFDWGDEDGYFKSFRQCSFLDEESEESTGSESSLMKIGEDDKYKLSFDNKWLPCDEEVDEIFFEDRYEFNDAIKELEKKCNWFDGEIYESRDGKYCYEADSRGLCIIRYR